jgi:small-conductance mechanosensitive channel
MNYFRNYLAEYTGMAPDTIGKIFLTITFIILIYLFQLLILRIVWRQTKNIKIRYQWKHALSFIFPFLGLFIIVAIWIQAFQQFGAFLGLFSAGLAIALKDPLTNLAGWFFITFRHPFVLGDRVQVGEHAGDVVDIRLFQFTILEIGNWVDADQSTGRIIHIPNSKVFTEPQANYSSGFNYIWNEIPVTITFESDWEKAKNVLYEVIKKHAEQFSNTAEKEIFEASRNYLIYYRHFSPIVYIKKNDFGITLTMRYLCDPRKRRGTESDIWQDVLTSFRMQEDIHLAYPTTRFYTYGETKPGSEHNIK